MDGQYQDVLHHCTDPGSEQERINVTFRWIKQHIAACPIAGNFNVEPTKIPCLSNGISAGFWVDLEVAWSVASAVTCKRNWESTWGNRMYFLVGCPVVAAAVLYCSVCSGRWLQPHFAVRASFDCHRWSCRVTQLVRCTPLRPAAWLLAVDKSRSSKSVEVHRVWEVYDDRLQSVAQVDAVRIDRALCDRDVWAIGSSAAGGPVPDRGLVLGRGTARFRGVRLVGPRVRKVRASAVDPVRRGGSDAHMYCYSSIAPLLGVRRRLKVVTDVLGEIVRSGFTLARSLELACILRRWSCASYFC